MNIFFCFKKVILSVFLLLSTSLIQAAAGHFSLADMLPEMIGETIEKLDPEDVINAALVCKDWANQAQSRLTQIKNKRKEIQKRYSEGRVDRGRTAHSAFFLASGMGYLEDLPYIVGANGLNINAYDEGGETVFHYVIINCSDLEVMRYLYKKGANPNVRNSGGDTPLSTLIVVGAGPDLLAKVRFLVEECNVEYRDLYGQTKETGGRGETIAELANAHVIDDEVRDYIARLTLYATELTCVLL